MSRDDRERRTTYRPTHAGHPTILYVRNISDRVRYDDLKHLFQKYGRIIDVTIPLDYYSGLPKGYCFVEFEDPRDAEEAHYRMARERLFGREIEIEFARGDRKTASEMRNRDKDRRYLGDRNGGSGGGRMYDRGERRDRSDRHERDRRSNRSRSRSGERRRSVEKRANGRSRSRDDGSYSRSKSRSYSRNKTPSPRLARSNSRDRSRSLHGKSEPRDSPQRGSPRSAKIMTSRSPSQA